LGQNARTIASANVLLKAFEDDGYIERTALFTGSPRKALPGWMSIAAGGANTLQAFVAMWFDHEIERGMAGGVCSSYPR